MKEEKPKEADKDDVKHGDAEEHNDSKSNTSEISAENKVSEQQSTEENNKNVDANLNVNEDKEKASLKSETKQDAVSEQDEVLQKQEKPIPPKIESSKEYKSAQSTQTPANEKTDIKVRYAIWPSLLLFICVVAVAAGVGYITLQGQQLIGQQETQLEALKTELAKQASEFQKAENKQAQQFRSELQKIQKTANGISQDLASAQQRLAAQGKRLRAMSDTSREDWLLAEAEYLLKLANQRVRIERSPQGADALIAEADNILRELDQPDLHGIRKEIAEDLAALRLMQQVDVEGIYLQLVALSQLIEKLPHRQAPQNKMLPEYPAESEEAPASVSEKLKNSWSRLVAEIKSHVRVSKHSVEVKPVLAAQDAFYLQQNLRLILERAQLALLREQQDIYTQSIQQAQEWIKTYYPESKASSAFIQQLATLGDKIITQDLPDISDSLNALHEYIEALHDLKGVSKPAQKAPAKSGQ